FSRPCCRGRYLTSGHSTYIQRSCISRWGCGSEAISGARIRPISGADCSACSHCWYSLATPGRQSVPESCEAATAHRDWWFFTNPADRLAHAAQQSLSHAPRARNRRTWLAYLRAFLGSDGDTRRGPFWFYRASGTRAFLAHALCP